MSTPSNEGNQRISAHDAELLETREQGESAGIGDSVRAEIRTENGILVKGPDSDEWDWREEALAAQNEERYRGKKIAELEDLAESRNLPVSGRPNKDELVSLLLSDDISQPPDDGLPLGYVDEEKSMKGPGDAWARDDDGNYANR